MSFKLLPYIFFSVSSPSFFVSVAILAICYYLYRVHKHMDVFPAAPGLPFLGNLLDYAERKRVLQNLLEHTLRTGKTIRYTIGPWKPMLLTVDRKMIEFTVTANKHLSKAKFYNFFHKWLGTGLLTSEGSKWKSRRRALTASFSQSSILQNFITVFESQGNLLMSLLENEEGKDSVDLLPIIKRFTMDVICECALGVLIHTQENRNSEYADNVEIVQEVAILRMISFFKRFDFLFRFTEDFRREKKALKFLDDFFDRILEEKKKINRTTLGENASPSSRNKPQAVLDLLLNVEIDGKPMTRDDIREEINTIVFAGYDTTATAICCTLYAVAKYPGIQDIIFEEQRQIFGDDIKNSKTTFEDIGKMEYLTLVIKESLRLYPPIPIAGNRVAKNRLKYDDDIMLPEGMNIAKFIYGIHRNPEYFHDPEEFIPERFRDETLLSYTYMPFSLGPRQCLGKRFSMLEMKCALSKIFRTYRIHPVPGHTLHLVPSMSLTAESGICVALKKNELCL